MRNYSDPDDQGSKSTGLAGMASTFRSGFGGGGGKQKTPKPKKAKAGKAPADDTVAGNKGLMAPTTSFQQATPGIGMAAPKMFKHGGRVRKTGLALVHRGEFVIPAKQSRRKSAGHKRTVIKA